MRRPPSVKAQSGAKASGAKASVVELAVLLALCPLAGIGAGLAFASALVGLMVTGIGLIAVAAYALAVNIDHWPRRNREEPRRLSVTDISTRRMQAQEREDVPRDESGRAPMAEPDEGPVIVTTAEPDRVVPFRAPSVGL